MYMAESSKDKNRASTGNKDPENPKDSRQNVLVTDKLNISVTENKMEAWGCFTPPFDSSHSLTEETVLSLLHEQKIIFGIQNEQIQEALSLCNLERRTVNEVLLAKGTLPESEVAPYMQTNPLLGRNNVPEISGRMDYRAYSPFIIVKKGQSLAKQKPRKPGKEGKDIYGTPIPYGTIQPESVTGGENTRMEKDYLIASIDGQMVEEKRVIHVRNSLHIKGSVGYETGHIAFPGDVIIEGFVSDGFKIYSGGSITIKQTFDVTNVHAKGDLNVGGGIIGRGQGIVKVGGRLRTKFIENCRVACRKTVSVSTEIINSKIYSLESVEMGDKSLIIGGEIYTVHGLRAAGIGKKGAKAARIHCGIDFTLLQEKEKNNNLLRLLGVKLERFNQLLENPQIQEEEKAKLEEFRRQLKEEQNKVSIEISNLLGRINTDEKATVEVTGEIIPGTLIEICQVALFVTEPLKKVKISLNKILGRLTAAPLE